MYMSPNSIEQIATAISSLIVNPVLGVLSVVRMSAENNTSFTPVTDYFIEFKIYSNKYIQLLLLFF